MMKSENDSALEPSKRHVPAPKKAAKLVDALYEDQVRTEAQRHMPKAIKTLVKIMKKGKSESVQRLAANDLIEHGHKRKSVDPLAGILEDGKLNIQVNLIQFESSEHGRETRAVASREVADIPAQFDQDDVIEVEPLPEVVISNPGEANEG